MLLTGGGPSYAPLAEIDFADARHDVEAHLFLPMHVARAAVGRVRAGGTLLFVSGTGGRRRRRARGTPDDQDRITGATYDVDGGQQLV